MTIDCRSSRCLARAAFAAVAMLLLAACGAGLTPPPRPSPASLAPGSPLLSHTLSDGDAWLRHYLMVGEHQRAIELLERSKALPGDRLLRRLQLGVVLHAAGRYEESNRAFAWAEDVADRRYTASLAAAAGAMLLNDRVIRYTPSRSELGAIAYYRMLNYLALGSPASAAVEARKASALMMRREAGDTEERCVGDGFLQYIGGLVFAAAGETNDALVSLRHAERAFGACGEKESVQLPGMLPADLVRVATAAGVREVATDVAERYGAPPADSLPSGDVVVIVEQGFVAHRAQEQLYLPLFEDDAEHLHDDVGTRLVADRIRGRLWADQAQPASMIDAGDVEAALWTADSDVRHVLKLAWPVMRQEACRADGVRLVLHGEELEAVPAYNLSRLAARDLSDERTAAATRLITRALLKYALAREAEEKAEKEGGEVAGFLVGLFTNTAANALERADTRSWSLLPDRVSVVRLRLPAGEYPLRLAMRAAPGAAEETLDLGTVRVQPGRTAWVTRRVWGAMDGERAAR